MGNPISATMANLFLSYHEQIWLDECPLSFKPLIYKRYVDDCFLVFREPEHADSFLNYLNNKHNSIVFTIETENENKLNFLDTTVTKTTNNNNFTTFALSIFRKATFTNLGMNFHSHTYFNFKLNNIRTLLYRAFEISSNWFNFDIEIKFLSEYFRVNGYPDHLFQKLFKSFLNRKLTPKVKKQSAEKMSIYHSIPFINNYSCNIINKHLSKFLENSYPHIKFNFIFTNSLRINNLVKHKDRLPRTLESGVVYLYKCGDCNATYIGSSKKALKTRASEHFSVSSRTGTLLARPPASSILDHIVTCKLNRNLDQFTILDQQNENQALRISESIEISIKNPTLNSDLSAFPLHLL